MVIYGYLLSFGYEAVIILLAYIVNKITKQTELSRKVVHFATGFLWIFMKLFCEGTIHSVIIPVLCLIISIVSERRHFTLIERGKGEYGTIFYTASMVIMSLLAYVYPNYFDAFGLGIISLSVGDAAACLAGMKWHGKSKELYNGKSFVGSAACALCTTIVVLLLSLSFDMGLFPLYSIILGILTALVELYSGKFDNISIPFTIFFVSKMLIYG